MSSGLYLRPTGLLYGDDASQAIASGAAGPLAGGPIAFSAGEILEGHAPQARRRTVSYPDLAGSAEPELRGLVGRVETPRTMPFGWASRCPMIMGIVNVTPDSFSDGGAFADAGEAIARGQSLLAAGADILDVGGESTRPGAEPVDCDAEVARAMPVVEELAASGARVSIDTRKAGIMQRAADAGAGLINDISALSYDDRSVDVAAASGLPVVLMHAGGDPATMQNDPRYDDVVGEIYDYLESRIRVCETVGIDRNRLIADPGIGFGKTVEHNLDLLRRLGVFHGLGVPLLVGVSRKGFIGAVSGEKDARKRIPGSIAGALAAVAQGAQLLRVHDVAETAQAIAVWRRLHEGDIAV